MRDGLIRRLFVKPLRNAGDPLRLSGLASEGFGVGEPRGVVEGVERLPAQSFAAGAAIALATPVPVMR